MIIVVILMCEIPMLINLQEIQMLHVMVISDVYCNYILCEV